MYRRLYDEYRNNYNTNLKAQDMRYDTNTNLYDKIHEILVKQFSIGVLLSSKYVLKKKCAKQVKTIQYFLVVIQITLVKNV